MRPLALALLALAACWPRASAPVRWLLGAAGGACLAAATWRATFEARDHEWAVVAIVLLAAGAVVALPELSGAAEAFGVRWLGWRWLMLGGSAAAVYACVPETDQMRDIAVAIAAGAVAEWLRRAPLPAPLYTAAWGLVAWSALYGATGRPSAVIGGLFALLAPVAAGFATRRGDFASVGVGVVWAVTALVVARTGGISMTTRPAVIAAVVGLAAAAGISAALWCRPARPPASAG